ncbi:MAG: NifB/NifX family molybdenum-iron cluster-binding protein [Candidatus Eremiobacterota bacterium]
MKKVAFSSTGRDLNALLDPRFGRCDFFVIVDVETDDVEVFENNAKNASGGAGIQAAQFVANMGVDTVVSGNFGPNAFQTLDAAEVAIYTGTGGTIHQNLMALVNNQLQRINGSTVASHYGMNMPQGGMGGGGGRGMGGGGGRGMGGGGGRGMGGGRGRGGGW